MIKVDFHSHSSESPDGGIRTYQYGKIIESGLLDCIAVTDHNSLTLALELAAKYPGKIIVGEEVMTSEGEIIGLFLSEKIMAGQSPEETVAKIKAQGGLVYIPHPFETVRHGITVEALDRISSQVDIVEVQNGRAFFQNCGPEAVIWATKNKVAMAASSDAHGHKGVGTTYTEIQAIPTVGNLVDLLKTANLVTDRPPIRTLLYPKGHRLRKRFSKS